MLIHLNLGSNIPPRRSYLEQAVKAVNDLPRLKIQGSSRIYETPAVELADDAGTNFYNLCLTCTTTRSAQDLLQRTQAIEERLGRPPSSKGTHRSRTIDIDLLLAENLILDTEKLVLPHPALTTRSFFLWPLLEIFPGASDPRSGTALKTHLRRSLLPPVLRTYPGFEVSGRG